MQVKVLDAVMGSGKSTRLIEMMAQEKRPIIYIAPLLDECHRIAGTLSDDDGDVVMNHDGSPIYENGHQLAHKMFCHPTMRNSGGSKLQGLKHLVSAGKNVVSTHQLFRLVDKELLEIVKGKGYLLVVDEVMTVWSKYSLHKDDDGESSNSQNKTDKEVLQLIKNGFIEVCPTGLLHWQHDKYDPQNTFHESVARLCDNHQLILSRGHVVFWEMTKELLRSFDDVWLATYMFDSSYMAHYLEMHGFDVLVDRWGKKPSEFAHLITLHTGKKLTDWADRPTALSYGSFAQKGNLVDEARVALDNFFRYATKSKPEDRLWTCFKSKRAKVGNNRAYTSRWLAFSTKATNQYGSASCVAYLCNNFASAFLLDMLKIRGQDFDQDMWALSEMLQWIWRSRIRNGEHIHLLIPSSRMRNLFERWLNDEFVVSYVHGQETVEARMQSENLGVVFVESPAVEDKWEGFEEDTSVAQEPNTFPAEFDFGIGDYEMPKLDWEGFS